MEFHEVDSILKEEISISSVTEEIKTKLATDSNFFRSGLKHFHNKSDKCHFCDQNLKADAIELIGKYTDYFQDKEAIAKQTILDQKKQIGTAIASAERSIKATLLAQRAYEDLKQYFPSQTGTTLIDVSQELESLKTIYSEVWAVLDAKHENVSSSLSRNNKVEYQSLKQSLETALKSNKEQCERLANLVSKSDGERLKLQRLSCDAFQSNFFLENQNLIDGVLEEEQAIIALETEVKALKLVSGNKVSAKTKVAATLKQLLDFMFGGKYTFDSDRFVVQRDKSDMSRGGDRTLSDGEKSVLAFCYFLAQSHMRVETKSDYERLFFIIDDPVSSLSFDYIYRIAQCLKNLRIEDGNILFEHSAKPRPRLLVFTHNDHFYNVTATNGVFKRESFFQLCQRDGKHRIERLEGFVSPHKYHLQHIFAVSENLVEPTYSTPNSIRAVIEGMWKFFRPDLKNLQMFISYLTSEHSNIEIRSILINDLSHGGKNHDVSPIKDDIKLATQEVIDVVRLIAPGQLNQIK